MALYMEKEDIIKFATEIFEEGQKWTYYSLKINGFNPRKEATTDKILEVVRDILNHNFFIDFNKYIFDKDDVEIVVDSSKLSGNDDYIRITHIPTGAFSWKECRYTYDGELQNVVEMLLEIVSKQVLKIWNDKGDFNYDE